MTAIRYLRRQTSEYTPSSSSASTSRIASNGESRLAFHEGIAAPKSDTPIPNAAAKINGIALELRSAANSSR